jgi:hypothetical protein
MLNEYRPIIVDGIGTVIEADYGFIEGYGG